MTADDSSAEPPDLEGDLGSVSWAYYESNQTIIFSGTGSFEPPSHSWDADSYSELPFETAVIQSGITGIGLIAGIIVAAVAIIAAGAYVFVRMKKKC